MKVIFYSETVQVPDFDQQVITTWLERVANSHSFAVRNLTYLFCNDDYILDANRRFLNHDYYTDIITFDYSTSKSISGDMLISLDTVRSNAEQMGVGYGLELMRVIVHGVLHLCGINDKGPGEREIMERFENEALELLPSNVYSDLK